MALHRAQSIMSRASIYTQKGHGSPRSKAYSTTPQSEITSPLLTLVT